MKSMVQAAAVGAAVQAASASALGDYGVLVQGDMVAKSHVSNGETLVRGNLTAVNTADFYHSLRVVGNTSGGTIQMSGNSAGRYYGAFGNSQAASVNLNGYTQLANNVSNKNDAIADFTSAWATAGAMSTAFRNIPSASYSGTVASSTVSQNGDNITFNATGMGDYAVFNINNSTFGAGTRNFMFGNDLANSTKSIVFNVAVTGSLNINENFSGNWNSNRIIWNFFNADQNDDTLAVTTSTTIRGSVLALGGSFESTGGANIDGFIAAGSFVMGGQVHAEFGYTGDVPTLITEVPSPAAAGLGAMGLMALAARRRR